MPAIEGMDKFQGDGIYHSSSESKAFRIYHTHLLIPVTGFKGARPDGRGKKAVVVGCCNSGHDSEYPLHSTDTTSKYIFSNLASYPVAQDFYEHGYDTTIVQRSSTYVSSI